MKKIVIAILIIALAAFGIYKYAYQSHRDIQAENAAFTTKGVTLVQEFAKNQDATTQKYLNKTIAVTGAITEIDGNAVVIDEAVFATFIEGTDISGISVGANLIIKGRCIGYDELLEQVKLDQSSITE